SRIHKGSVIVGTYLRQYLYESG
ncbi:hypothetical protein D043_4686B, partial [Vibrio parahaemolyticus EKP-021]